MICEETPVVENGYFHFLDNSTVGNVTVVNSTVVNVTVVDRTYLAQAEVICDSGYYNYDGDDNVTCGPQGTWMGDVQRCHRKSIILYSNNIFYLD